jgi:hypothetical protein
MGVIALLWFAYSVGVCLWDLDQEQTRTRALTQGGSRASAK